MMPVSRCVCTNIVFNREGTRCAVVTPKGFVQEEALGGVTGKYVYSGKKTRWRSSP